MLSAIEESNVQSSHYLLDVHTRRSGCACACAISELLDNVAMVPREFVQVSALHDCVGKDSASGVDKECSDGWICAFHHHGSADPTWKPIKFK